mmetsp:Transcript_114634/g.222626  ORF Transcript_114634/g.222626 Transcript_114634/m.222626 type:complete len:385 (+) Transcript_114634:66-1220(+)
MAPLVTVPPCDAAAGSFSEHSCEAEVTKMSRSCRRKLRDRRVAVRHAIRNTSDLQKTTNNMFHSTLVTGLQGNSSNFPHLDDHEGMSSIFFKLDSMVQCLSETLALLKDMFANTVSHSECTLRGGALNADAVLSDLNPLAPEFIPKSQCGADTDVHTPLRAGQVHCSGCWEPLSQSCFCGALQVCLDCMPIWSDGQHSDTAKVSTPQDSFSATGTNRAGISEFFKADVCRIEFYNSGQTVVAYAGKDDKVPLSVSDLPRTLFSAVMQEAKTKQLLIKSYLNKGLPSVLQRSATNDEHEEDSEDMLNPAQMRSMVDLVVDEVSKTRPEWQNIPGRAAGEMVENLKATFPDEDGALYSSQQAMELMKETGKLCGELALKYKVQTDK